MITDMRVAAIERNIQLTKKRMKFLRKTKIKPLQNQIKRLEQVRDTYSGTSE